MNWILIGQGPEVQAALKAAETLSAKSDRYLFLAALIVGGLFVVWAIKHLVKQNAELIHQLKEEQTCYESKIEKMIEKEVALVEKMAVCIDRNTAMGEKNTEMFERCAEALREASK